MLMLDLKNVTSDIELFLSASSGETGGAYDVALGKLKIALDAAKARIAQARNLCPDLNVLGTHGRHGLSRLVMGSDPEAVLREARVPVLLVRSRAAPQASRNAFQPEGVRVGQGGERNVFAQPAQNLPA